MGNGFDVGLNLKTRYEDFYNEYCKPNTNDNENIKRFKKMLLERHDDEKKKIIDWADFEKAFGMYSMEFNVETKKNILSVLEIL